VAGPTTETETGRTLAALFGRSLIGGVMMGLANLVPGISGGTMLLAAGVYPDFISGVAEVTTLRFKRRSVVVLAGVVLAAGVAILTLAGLVKALVVEHRWVMYSLFIGLTLGGVPIVRKLIGKHDSQVWGGAAAGFVSMGALAWVQLSGIGTAEMGASGVVMMFIAGVAGASAMILPGVSGGYLLLVLGVYVHILAGIDAFKDGLKAMDPAALVTPLTGVVIPVGLGVVIGIVVVSNVLKVLLERFRKPTLGFLLGLLVGAVIGLFPFQHGVEPEVGDMVKGRTLTPELLAELDAEDWPVEFFTPTVGQVGGSALALTAGLGLTFLVSLVGGKSEDS